jgi:signal transduction histidine kinase
MMVEANAQQTAAAELQELRAALAERQDALQRSQDLLTGVLDQAPLMLLVLDMPDLSVRLLSEYGRRFFGMSEQDYGEHLLGGSLHALGPCPFRTLDGSPLDWEELPPIRAALEGVVLEAIDLCATRHDGSDRVLNCSAAPIRDPQGQMVAAVAMAVDVTAQRQVEAQRRNLLARIKDSERLEAVGVLSGGIAHDFNNLLATIMGHNDLAQGLLEADHPIQPDLAAIGAACERAGLLVQRMLCVTGSAVNLHTPLDLPALLREEIETQRPLLAPGVLLIVDLGKPLAALTGERSALRQLLAALLGNANDMLGNRPGEIVVALRQRRLEQSPVGLLIEGSFAPAEYLELVVADDGPGMETVSLRHAFEAFGVDAGQGLGLAAVRGTVRAHHGQLWAQSAPGAGLRITVLFPVGN